jgi:hypothetical protein
MKGQPRKRIGRPPTHTSRRFRDFMRRYGTGGLDASDPLAKLVADFKAEWRATLGGDHWNPESEHWLEQGAIGFARSQRALQFELARPYDGTKSLARDEATAGCNLMNESLQKIRDARDRAQAEDVQAVLRSIRESRMPAEEGNGDGDSQDVMNPCQNRICGR